LYARLAERAKAASEKLRGLRANPDASESCISSPLLSRMGSFSERSLSRSRNNVEGDKPAVLTKGQLTPDERDALYARLNDRSKEASSRLRDLRANPEAGTESTVSSAKSSKYGSFDDRSLFRSKSVGRAVSGGSPQTEQPAAPRPLSAEEQEALYARLIDRAKAASQKLIEVRSTVSREGASYRTEAPKPEMPVPIDGDKQEFFDRLATPKKVEENEPGLSSFRGVSDRSLLGPPKVTPASKDCSTGPKKRNSFIPVRASTIRSPARGPAAPQDLAGSPLQNHSTAVHHQEDSPSDAAVSLPTALNVEGDPTDDKHADAYESSAGVSVTISPAGKVLLSPKSADLAARMQATPGGVFY
jgi:hypothetical protein